MTARTPEAVRQYADAIIETLAADFPDLQDPTVAGVVRASLQAYLHVGGHLEVIVDSPITARWRLTGDRDHPGRVRLGCWHANPSEQIREREERLNAALRAIPMEVQQ